MLQTTMHSKGLKFGIAFCWLANDLSCYVFYKHENSWKLIVLRPSLVKIVHHHFLVLMWLRGVRIFIYKWSCKQVKCEFIFAWTIWTLWEKNIFLYRLPHVRESFIIHQVFYSLFTLIWGHSLFELSKSLI